MSANLSRWLPIAEVVALILVVLGLIRFFATGSIAFLVSTLVLALLLNQWNRRHSDRRSLRRTIAELRQVRQELTEELEDLRQTLQRQSAGSFSQLQSSQDLELAMVQLRLQNTRLDHSLQQVVVALNELLPQPVDLSPAPGSASSEAAVADRPTPSPTAPASATRAPGGTPAKDSSLEPSLPSFPVAPAAATHPDAAAEPGLPNPASPAQTTAEPGISDRPATETAPIPDGAAPASGPEPVTADSAAPADPAASPVSPGPTSASPATPAPIAANPAPAAPAPSSPRSAPPQPWQEALSWQQGLSFVAHSGWVNAMALSADGQRLVTGGTDQQIRIWQLPEGRLQAEWSTPSPISALAFSPDHRLLASGNYDHRIQLWDLEEERLIKTLEGHYGSVKALTFFVDPLLAKIQAIAAESSTPAAPNLQMGLLSGSYDQTLRIWDLERGRSDCLEGHEGSIQSLSLTPQQDCAISGGEEGHLRLWRLPEGQIIDVLTANSSAVEALALSPDGVTLASGCSNGSLYLWHLPSRTPLYGIEGHTGPVTALALTPDGQTLISGGADGRLKLWHVPTGQPQGNLADPIDAILNLALSPSGQLLISSHPGGQIQLWWRQEAAPL